MSKKLKGYWNYDAMQRGIEAYQRSFNPDAYDALVEHVVPRYGWQLLWRLEDLALWQRAGDAAHLAYARARLRQHRMWRRMTQAEKSCIVQYYSAAFGISMLRRGVQNVE